jgi:hypothetical protein
MFQKWINGQPCCTTCACSLSAAAKNAKCVDCCAAEAMNPLPTSPPTQRTCDHSAKVLPSYEQSRRVCYSCRRKQLHQTKAAKTDMPTAPPEPVEAPTPLALPSHILQRFRLIPPAPASGSSAVALVLVARLLGAHHFLGVVLFSLHPGRVYLLHFSQLRCGAVRFPLAPIFDPAHQGLQTLDIYG